MVLMEKSINNDFETAADNFYLSLVPPCAGDRSSKSFKNNIPLTWMASRWRHRLYCLAFGVKCKQQENSFNILDCCINLCMKGNKRLSSLARIRQYRLWKILLPMYCKISLSNMMCQQMSLWLWVCIILSLRWSMFCQCQHLMYYRDRTDGTLMVQISIRIRNYGLVGVKLMTSLHLWWNAKQHNMTR